VPLLAVHFALEREWSFAGLIEREPLELPLARLALNVEPAAVMDCDRVRGLAVTQLVLELDRGVLEVDRQTFARRVVVLPHRELRHRVIARGVEPAHDDAEIEKAELLPHGGWQLMLEGVRAPGRNSRRDHEQQHDRPGQAAHTTAQQAINE
jgi:hypothetical protein